MFENEIEGALSWLCDNSSRTEAEAIGECIIMSILPLSISQTKTLGSKVAKRLFESANKIKIETDPSFLSFVKYSAFTKIHSPKLKVPITKGLVLNDFMKMALLYRGFDDKQKQDYKKAFAINLGTLKFYSWSELDYYYFCHYIMAITAFGIDNYLKKENVEECSEIIKCGIEKYSNNLDLVSELYLTSIFLGIPDANAIKNHIFKIKMSDGCFDKGSDNYESYIHSTLVGLWLAVECEGRGLC